MVECATPRAETLLRQAIVTEALSWIGTPFHPRAARRGAGVECGWLIYGVLRDLGLLPEGYTEESIPQYSPQFWMHRTDEIYLEGIRNIGFRELDSPVGKPGDVIIVQMGRVFAHGGIITDWPYVVHANPTMDEVTRSNSDSHRILRRDHPRKLFTLFGTEETA